MKYIINDTLIIEYPESFRMLDQNEIAETFIDNNTNRFAIRDENNHIIISVYYNKLGLMSLIVDNDLVRESNETVMAKKLDNFKCLGKSMLEVAGDKKASEIIYSYTIDDIPQIGRSIYFRKNKMLYSLNMYHQNDDDKADSLCMSIMDSLRSA